MQMMRIEAEAERSVIQDCLDALSTERYITMRAVTQAARILLRSSADTVYPPSADGVPCRDGKRRDLGEPYYINRLYEFIAQEVATAEAAKLLRAELAHIVATITRLTYLKPTDLPEAAMVSLHRHLLISVFSFLSTIQSLRPQAQPPGSATR